MSDRQSPEWKRHRGPCYIKVDSVAIPPSTICPPNGRIYVVDALCLCGFPFEAESLALETISAGRLARQTQIVGSIQHIERRGCSVCSQMMAQTLTPTEKRYVFSQSPTVGRAIGCTETIKPMDEYMSEHGAPEGTSVGEFMDRRREAMGNVARPKDED